MPPLTLTHLVEDEDEEVEDAQDGALRWPDMSTSSSCPSSWMSPRADSCVESAVLGAVLVEGVVELDDSFIESAVLGAVRVEGVVEFDAAESCLENAGPGAVLVGEVAEGGDVVVGVGLAEVEVDKHRIDGRSRGRVDEVTVVPLSPAASDGEIDEVLDDEGVVVGECLAVADGEVVDVLVSFIFSLRAWFGDGGFNIASMGTSMVLFRPFVLSNAPYLL